jgi:hypothetical protein
MSKKSLDFFLEEPQLSLRHYKAIPTEEMYRFIPPEDEIINIDKSDPSKNYRYIFNGQPKTQFEKQKLSEFLEYESKTGKLNYPQNWLESDTMRLLQASEYDIKKTYTTINENIQWINSIPKSINNKIISLLNSGFMYVYGRDHHFRPIIIVSIKMVKNVISQKYSFDEINESIVYLMNYIIKYILIPGQIENWIVFVDFEDVGISDIGDFKKILSTLSKQRGRVFKNYFVNIGGFIKMSVNAVVKMFSSVARKMVILGHNELKKAQEIISPENLEKKYGGLGPDIVPGGNNLFPPIMPSSNFALSGEKLNILSPEDYKEMCLNPNSHKPFVICPKYQEIWDKEKEMELQKEKEKESNKNKIQEDIIMKSNNDINENKNMGQNNFERKSNVYENRRISKNRNSLKNNANEIKDFLSQFEGYNMLENYEQRKYPVPSAINLKEINLFFNRIKENQKFYKFE